MAKKKRKHWKDPLTKKEKKHLLEHSIRFRSEFDALRKHQKKLKEESEFHFEACWTCWQIENKLSESEAK